MNLNFVEKLRNCNKEDILHFISSYGAASEENNENLVIYFEKWNTQEENGHDLNKHVHSPDGSPIPGKYRDPRESILNDLFCNSNSNAHKHILMRHHYSLGTRRSGTIYEKKTYMQFVKPDVSIFSSVPAPPESWFPSLGGSVDYVNGTLHFPMVMPDNAADLSSYTIRRQKVSAAHFLFLAAQFYVEHLEICDDSLLHVIDILSNKKSFDSKEYTPRKITVAQSKELLHAWVAVYVFEKKEYMPVLDYYLYAGYVITISNNHGGVHEKV